MDLYWRCRRGIIGIDGNFSTKVLAVQSWHVNDEIHHKTSFQQLSLIVQDNHNAKRPKKKSIISSRHICYAILVGSCRDSNPGPLANNVLQGEP